MVDSFKDRLSKIDSAFLWSFGAIVLLTIAIVWFSLSYMLNEVVQGLLYPYSDFPVIVYSVGDILIFPGVAVLCLAVLFGVNHIALTLFEKSFFVKMKERLMRCIAIVLCVAIVAVIVEFVGWPLIAKSNGYRSCPSGTLLLGYKTSTAWAKDVSMCYDAEVKDRLSTGTYEQVVQVANYLNKKPNLDNK